MSKVYTEYHIIDGKIVPVNFVADFDRYPKGVYWEGIRRVATVIAESYAKWMPCGRIKQ